MESYYEAFYAIEYVKIETPGLSQESKDHLAIVKNAMEEMMEEKVDHMKFGVHEIEALQAFLQQLVDNDLRKFIQLLTDLKTHLRATGPHDQDSKGRQKLFNRLDTQAQKCALGYLVFVTEIYRCPQILNDSESFMAIISTFFEFLNSLRSQLGNTAGHGHINLKKLNAGLKLSKKVIKDLRPFKFMSPSKCTPMPEE